MVKESKNYNLEKYIGSLVQITWNHKNGSSNKCLLKKVEFPNIYYAHFHVYEIEDNIHIIYEISQNDFDVFYKTKFCTNYMFSIHLLSD